MSLRQGCWVLLVITAAAFPARSDDVYNFYFQKPPEAPAPQKPGASLTQAESTVAPAAARRSWLLGAGVLSTIEGAGASESSYYYPRGGPIEANVPYAELRYKLSPGFSFGLGAFMRDRNAFSQRTDVVDLMFDIEASALKVPVGPQEYLDLNANVGLVTTRKESWSNDRKASSVYGFGVAGSLSQRVRLVLRHQWVSSQFVSTQTQLGLAVLL